MISGKKFAEKFKNRIEKRTDRKYRKNKLYTDEEWLRTVMKIFLRPKHIAKMCGVSSRTIIKWLNRYHIDRSSLYYFRPEEFNNFTPMEVDS